MEDSPTSSILENTFFPPELQFPENFAFAVPLLYLREMYGLANGRYPGIVNKGVSPQSDMVSSDWPVRL